jgi:hypothetical protein
MARLILTMSSAKHVIFRLSNLRRDGARNESWQILLRVVADFSILIDSKCLYSEREFCVAEFALAISRWLDRVGKSGEEFMYESMEAEEVGLVWIKPYDSGWHVGSVHQEYAEMNVFNLEEIRRPAEEFLNQLENEMSAKLDIRFLDLYRELDGSQ